MVKQGSNNKHACPMLIMQAKTWVFHDLYKPFNTA